MGVTEQFLQGIEGPHPQNGDRIRLKLAQPLESSWKGANGKGNSFEQTHIELTRAQLSSLLEHRTTHPCDRVIMEVASDLVLK